jgi:mono/diheme cytochrome c family protein
MARRVLLLTLGSLAIWASVVRAQGAPQQAQIEKGRLVVAQVCTTCHTTLGRMLQVHKQTPEQWKDLVYFMISRGAQVMPDEIEAVTAYLASSSGRDRPAARNPAPDSKTR